MNNRLDRFIDAVDVDIAWRKKEISELVLLHDENNSELIVKTSLLLIYSHWEGCVKNICKLYLGYVSKKNVELSDLTSNFSAIKLKGKIKEMMGSSDTLTLINELAFMRSLSDNSAKKFKVSSTFLNDDKDKTVINTTGNLNYEVYCSLACIVGIGARECLSTKSMMIDNTMLNNRNKIAHGSKVVGYGSDFDLDINSISELKTLVFAVIDSLADDLKHYAENEFYLIEKEADAFAYNSVSNAELGQTLNGGSA